MKPAGRKQRNRHGAGEMRDRLVDDLDHALLRMRSLRVQVLDAHNRPDNDAGHGEQKAERTNQVKDSSAGANRTSGGATWRSRLASLSPTPAEYRAGRIDAHPRTVDHARFARSAENHFKAKSRT